MAPGSANPFKPVSPGGVLDGSITVAVYVPSANFVDGVAAFQSMAPMQPQPPYPGKVCCSQASRTIYCLSAQLVGISGHPACVCPGIPNDDRFSIVDFSRNRIETVLVLSCLSWS